MRMVGWLRQQVGLFLIIILYVALTYLNSTNIPLSKAPDEYVHFLYGRFIAQHHRLPTNDEERQRAGYKSDQPPLYYGLLALTIGWVDPDVPPKLKMTWDSPRRKLVDIVLPRAMIVRTEDETWPYSGEILAWMSGRWLSIFLGVLTIILVYITTLEIFPGSRVLAAGAAGAVAFMPRFTFISAVLSDENLLGVIIGFYFLRLIRLIKGQTGFRHFVLIGFSMGLAVMTKYSAIVLPLEFLLLLFSLVWIKKLNWSQSFKGGAIAIGVLGLTSMAWFVFQGWYFNQIDELGLVSGIVRPLIAGDETEADSTTFIIASTLTGTNEAGETTEAAEGSIWDWGKKFFIEFWQVEVYGQPPLYPLLYNFLLMGGVCGLALLALVRVWQDNQGQSRLWLTILLLHLLIFIPIPLGRYLLTGRIHDTAQARYLMFSAAPAIGILLAWGTANLVGSKHQAWGIVGLVGLMFGLSIAQLYHYYTAFPAPLPVRAGVAWADSLAQPVSVSFQDGLKLAGYHHQIQDNRLLVTLYWQSLAYANEDYYTELSLLDNQGQIMTQAAAHPAAGRYPTRAWEPGDNIRADLVLPLVGVKPGRYQLHLRLIGWTGPLLTAAATETVDLGSIIIPNLVSPQPTRLFEPESQFLNGFDLWQAGAIVSDQPVYRYLASIPVTISFKDDTLLENATLNLWLVGPTGERYPAIAGGAAAYTFIVDYHWPSGAYHLAVEIWRQGQLIEQTHSDAILTVENRPIPLTPPAMPAQVKANFDSKILLLGYDLPARRVEPGQGLPLVLYWQALERMKESYTIFVRLLDQNQQVWGGYDRLPRELYPTFLWVPGEVVSDGFAVSVKPETPAGVYNISLGLYLQQEGQAISLPLVANGQPIDQTNVTIGPIKVDGPPPGLILSASELGTDKVLVIKLGEPPLIALHGYDLRVENKQLYLKLYWESIAQTAIDWSVFVHAQDEVGTIVAQRDGPLGGGKYPSSLWEPGEIIADEMVISLENLPLSRRYHLYVGLYNLITGERLPVPGHPANEILLTQNIIMDN